MIDHVDHIVLTTRDLAGCIRFYTEVLGMKLEKFHTPAEQRLALKFGSQKINLHEWGREFDPRAHVAVARRSTCTSGAGSSTRARTSRCRAASTCASSPPCRSTRW